MDSNNRNSAGGNGSDLDRILENAATNAARSSSSNDPTLEKARSEINAQADLMIREIEERRARRMARQREMEQQILAEENAKARRMARAKLSESSVLSSGSRPSAKGENPKPAPSVSSVDSGFGNKSRSDARPAPFPASSEVQRSRNARESAQGKAPANISARSARPSSVNDNGSGPAKRQTVIPGQTQKMPKITESVAQNPSSRANSDKRSAAAEQLNRTSAPRGARTDAPRSRVQMPSSSQSGKKTKAKKKNGEINMLKEIRDWVLCLVIAVALALVIRNFVFTLVKVQGASMQPTLQENDRLYVNRFFYKPEKGDVIIFKPESDPDRPYVKRVIATEGDTVYIDFENGDVYVNGQIIDEPYIKDKTNRTGAYIMECIANGQYSKDNPIVVEKDKVFVMGDNRNNSRDSREIGQVPEKEIVGGAVFRFWPVTNFGSVAYPIETSYLIEDENHNFTFVS